MDRYGAPAPGARGNPYLQMTDLEGARIVSETRECVTEVKPFPFLVLQSGCLRLRLFLVYSYAILVKSCCFVVCHIGQFCAPSKVPGPSYDVVLAEVCPQAGHGLAPDGWCHLIQHHTLCVPPIVYAMGNHHHYFINHCLI